MRSRLFTLLTILFLVGACKGKKRIPADVLPQKKMQAVMYDMMRADQFLTDYVLRKDSGINKVTESLKYYGEIFAIHKITKEQFQKSFSFYKDHPELFKVIMDSMTQVAPTQMIQPVAEPDTIRPLQK